MFVAFISCNPHESKQPNYKTVKLVPSISNKKDTLIPPKVVLLTSSNQPKIIKAGKPTITIDSSNGGRPFFTNYGTEDGLPITSISGCIQDNKGNIWFATMGGGVSRYDGKDFTTFTTAQGLADNGVDCIMQDKTGNIWFGTGGSGVSRYDGKKFTNYTTANGLSANIVNSIIQDKTGNIWFGTFAGVSMFNGKRFTNFSKEQGMADNYVGSILQDKKENIWFGTIKGASRYDGEKITNYTTEDGMAGNIVNSIMQDTNGNLWFGTDNGASEYNGIAFTNYLMQKKPGAKEIKSILQDKTGNIWFGSHAGITRYNGKSFTDYTTAQGLAGNDVLNIMQDKAGSIWFTTFDGGASRYDGAGIISYTKAEGLPPYLIFSILQDKADNLWLGSTGGVSMYNGKSFVHYTIAQGLAGNEILTIMQDKAGAIWFATSGGVSRYNGKNFTNYTTAQGLPNRFVNTILEDKTGSMWLGTRSGLCRYDGKSFTNYTTAQGLISNDVTTIMQDKKSNIWLGTTNGVSCFDGKSFINYTTTQGLAGNNVYIICQDDDGNIWFGTDGHGVSRYNGKNFTNYTTAEGMSDNEIYVITKDSARNLLWFGTNAGLTSLHKNKFDIYNKGTGYPIKDVNSNSLITDNKGIIWAGCGDNKLIRFDYDAINKNPEPLVLQIENIKVDGEIMCWNNLAQNTNKKSILDSLTLINEMVTAFGKILPAQLLDSMKKKFSDVHFDSITPYYFIPTNLVVPYKDRNITFDFAAIEPDKPKQVKYQYMLEGYDKDWSPLNNNTTAVFGNISGGSYTFKLKALSPYGVWSETSYSFKVLPPWWKTWWAYLIYIICFAALMFWIGKMQQQKLIKKERAKNQLRELEMQALRAQMNPHFIFNCLSSINRFVLMNETEAASDYLTKFSRLIRTVLNNSKKPLISLEDEMEMLKLYLDMEKLRFQNGFNYILYVDDAIELQNIFIPPLLFQPFAENAVWHGLMHKKENGQLDIRLSVSGSILNFEIEDNGVGRAAASSVKSKSAEKNKSLGLQITKDRLSLINGYANEKTFFEIVDLQDEDGNAAGTKVILKIKFSETTDG